MLIHGKCHCGAIRYEAQVNPAQVAVCHCTDCQQFAGAPYRAMVSAAAEHFHMDGQPQLYAKTAASGRHRVQAFCGTCGTHLYAVDPGDHPDRYGLRIGAIAERRELGPPMRQVWCQSALPWAMDLTAIPQIAAQS